MNIITKIKRRLSGHTIEEKDPAWAYDLWAENYDKQPDNLMLALDEEMFQLMIKNVDFKDKTIIDVGCGTGRHWPKIYEKEPGRLVGYDVSEGMLDMLKQKFPEAEVYKSINDQLTESEDGEADFIISTLALAHIEDLEKAIEEWDLVLDDHGQIIITDYHPDAFKNGADRTFRHNSELIAIKNYIHPIEKIISLAEARGMTVEALEERCIDERVKHYYEKQNAVHVYDRFKGIPIIYGLHLKVRDVAS